MPIVGMIGLSNLLQEILMIQMSIGDSMAHDKMDEARRLARLASEKRQAVKILSEQIAALLHEADNLARRARNLVAEANDEVMRLLSGEHVNPSPSTADTVEVSVETDTNGHDEGGIEVPLDDPLVQVILQSDEKLTEEEEQLGRALDEHVTNLPAVTMPTVRVGEEMPANILQSGMLRSDEFPLPPIPLRIEEVAELHREYLDQLDGRQSTVDELQRFCTHKSERYGKMMFRYCCVVCTKDILLPIEIDGFDCRQFGSVVVCEKCGFLVIGHLKSFHARTIYRDKSGNVTEGSPRPMYLETAIKGAYGFRSRDKSAHDSACQSNLKFEAELIARLRAERDEDDEPELDIAYVTEQNHTPTEYVATTKRAVRTEKRHEPQMIATPSGEMVEVVLDNTTNDCPKTDEIVLKAAVTEVEFMAILSPLWAYSSRLKRAMNHNEALMRLSAPYKRAKREVSYILDCWNKQSPTSYELFRQTNELFGLTKKIVEALSDEELKRKHELQAIPGMAERIAQRLSRTAYKSPDQEAYEKATQLARESEIARVRAKQVSGDLLSAAETSLLESYEVKTVADVDAGSSESTAAAETARLNRRLQNSQNPNPVVARAVGKKDKKGKKKN